MSTPIEVNHNKSEPDDDADSIEVNHNKSLEEDAARRVRLSRRGRKPGWGKRHDAGTRPKTFKNFPRRAFGLITTIKVSGPDTMKLSDAEIVEQALAHYGRALARRLANRNPTIAERLTALAGEPGDE
jgi:hypothetical protein